MYIITNRVISKGKGLKIFGDTPSPSGPNELRAVKVNKKGSSWITEQVKDRLTQQEVEELVEKYKGELNLNIDPNKNWYGSLEVACEVFHQAKTEGKSILIFVHGYNNDVTDVLKTAYELEKLYNVVVIPFTWPANGGGIISGTASYLSDKSDARASSGALNRFVGKLQSFHLLLNEFAKSRIKEIVGIKFKDKNNPMAEAELYSKLMEKECSIKINLLCHSMGNYLLKHSLI